MTAWWVWVVGAVLAGRVVLADQAAAVVVAVVVVVELAQAQPSAFVVVA